MALFTIGAVLARSQMSTSDPAPLREYVPVALKKLLLHPLLVWGIGHAAIALGAPLDPFALTCMVLVACLPSASNVSLLSERFGANTARIASEAPTTPANPSPTTPRRFPCLIPRFNLSSNTGDCYHENLSLL